VSVRTELEHPTGDEKRVVPAERVVLYLRYDEAQWKDKPPEQFEDYKKQLEDIAGMHKRAGTDVLVLSKAELEDAQGAEKTKPEEERARYVLLDNNITNYFNEVALGQYAKEQWKAFRATNARLEEEIKELEKQTDNVSESRTLSQARKERRIKEYRAQIAELESKKISFWKEMLRLPWQTAMWCGVTWLAIFLIIFKGVRIVGKVVMWTVSLPLVLLLILLIRGVTLPGSTEGIVYYLRPSWEQLKNAQVWLAAYGQVFFSLSLGFGILIAYASYKPRDSEITNDAFITAFANCGTSFFAAFAVFSVLGYLARINNADVGSVVAGGAGLVFITYPVAIAKIGAWGPVIGVIFFACLLLLGIDSAFSIVEGVLTGIRDKFTRASKALITAAFCVVGFVCSLFFATSSGLMWLDIVDRWMGTYGLATVGLLECIAVAYFFRHHEIEEFANRRSEIQLGGWFELFIKYVTPVVLIFLLGSAFVEDVLEPYGAYHKIIPWSVGVAGWGLYAVLIAMAMALGGNWTKFAWVASAGLVFFLFWLWLRGADVEAGVVEAAAMAGVGVVLLYGGLLTCLRLALRRGKRAPEPDLKEPNA
ncbi:MAG: hypothetical protein R6V58_01485, partial [Planctomycetota bacterium]